MDVLAPAPRRCRHVQPVGHGSGASRTASPSPTPAFTHPTPASFFEPPEGQSNGMGRCCMITPTYSSDISLPKTITRHNRRGGGFIQSSGTFALQNCSLLSRFLTCSLSPFPLLSPLARSAQKGFPLPANLVDPSALPHSLPYLFIRDKNSSYSTGTARSILHWQLHCTSYSP